MTTPDPVDLYELLGKLQDGLELCPWCDDPDLACWDHATPQYDWSALGWTLRITDTSPTGTGPMTSFGTAGPSPRPWRAKGYTPAPALPLTDQEDTALRKGPTGRLAREVMVALRTRGRA